MSKQREENVNLNALLFITFWVAVIIECVSLYKRKYAYYGFSRAVIAPILLVRLITSTSGYKISRYIYLFLLFSILADLLTIFGTAEIEYVGLNFYTISYLCFACFFLSLKYNYHSISIIAFFLSGIIVTITTLIGLFAPELHKQVFYVQMVFHPVILILLGYALLANKNKFLSIVFGNFFLSVLVIIMTNLLFGLDVFFFHYKYSIIETIIGLGNGFYLFLITRGALKQVKKVG